MSSRKHDSVAYRLSRCTLFSLICLAGAGSAFGQISTSTSASLAPSPVDLGTTPVVTVTVTASDGSTPDSAVSCSIETRGHNAAYSANLQGGVASIALQTIAQDPVGTYTLACSYVGSSNYAASSATTISFSIISATTTAALTVSLVPPISTYGTPITVNVAVAAAEPPTSGPTITPTGTVQCSAPGVTIPPMVLVNGVGSTNVTGIPVGNSHNVACTYSGDGTFYSIPTPVSATETVLAPTVASGVEPLTPGTRVYLFSAGLNGPNTSPVSLITGSNASLDANGNGYLQADGNGNFSLQGNYTCPSASDPPVYLIATSAIGTGGLPVNPYMRLVSVLPVPCSEISSVPTPQITAATTVAAAFALASFADTTDEGFSTTLSSLPAMTTAFSYANILASSYTGSPSYIYSSAAVENDVDSVADMLVPCATSGGNACQQLLQYSTVPTRSAPVDTWRAALNIAEYPANNVGNLGDLIGTNPPFIPTYSVLPDSWQLPTSGVPVVASLSSPTASIGSTINIVGSDFQPSGTSAPTTVVVGGISSPITSLSDNAITTTVEQGAVSSSVQVYIGNNASNPVPMDVGTSIQSLTVTLSPTTSTFGQAITVSVTASSGNAIVPTGNVSCTAPAASGVSVISISLGNGSGAGTVSGIPVGQQQPITCSYNGDANFVSSSPTVAYEIVNAGPSTPISLSISPTAPPYYFGEPIVLTTTLPAAATGTVTFLDNGLALPSPSLVTLSSGVATYTYKSPSLGNHSFTANYSGDANYMGVSSAALPLTVVLNPTTTLVTLSPATSWYGYPLTVNVTVAGEGGAVVSAGGTISCIATSSSGSTIGQVSGSLSTTSTLAELLLSGLPLTSAQQPYSVVCSFTSGNASEYGNSNSSASPAYGTVINPPNPTNSATGSLLTPRSGHQATLLEDGTVLVTGGTYGHVTTDNSPASPESFVALQSAEIYSDAGFAYAAQMTVPRWQHTATLLSNGTGQVLITGGSNGSSAVASAEIFTPGSTPGSPGTFTATALYDSSTGTFSGAVSQMNAARFLHTATLLPNGQVLLAGGQSSDGSILNSAELYNPLTGAFTLTGPMNSARWMHTATLLPDGTVLIAGGANASGPVSTAEVYNPGTNQFTPVGSMLLARSLAQATLLGNGTVLITGGATCSSGSDYPDIRNTSCSSAEAEIYSGGSFTATTTSMMTARYEHTAVTLKDGTVLIAGGITTGENNTTNSEEVYNPTTGVFSSVGSLVAARWDQTATVLLNGNVLSVGGEDGQSVGYNPVGTSGGYEPDGPSAEIYGAVYLSGGLYPKYMVLNIMYAPPGSGSTMTYTGQSVVGTTNSSMNSFTNGLTLNANFENIANAGNPSSGSTSAGSGSVSVVSGNGSAATGGCSSTAPGSGSGSGGGIGSGGSGVTLDGNGNSINGSYTYELAENSSFSLNTTTSTCTSVPGPSSSTLGVDHESDIIWLWLNPATDYTLTPSNGPLVWDGYATNPNDPNVQSGQMDIVPISVAQLDGTSPIPPELQQILDRNWDPVSQGGAGALTQNDLLTILARDPFATNLTQTGQSTLPTNTPVAPTIPVFDPNIPTTDPVSGVCGGRYSFSPSTGQVFPFSPLSVGNGKVPPTDISQPVTSLYSLNLATQQSWTKTTTDTYSVGVSASLGGANNNSPIDGTILLSLKVQDSLSFVNSWNQASNNSSSTIQTLSIKSPSASSGYQGPSQMQVWQDNLYGTFMFYPKPEDTNVILQSSQPSVQFGQPLTLTATVVPAPSISASPSGTVTFYDDCSVLGSPVHVVNGTASTSVTLSGGANPPVTQNHTIRALYSGDANFFHNVGNTLSQIATSTNLPYISTGGISPASGAIGSTVTISGVNFGTSGTVTFNGVPSVASTWTSTSIVVKVPNGATSGLVAVTTGSTSSNSVAFAVSQPSGAATTTTLILSPSTSWSGYPVVASAQVSTQTNAIPVGTVACVSSPSTGATNPAVSVNASGLAQVQLEDIPVLASGATSPATYTETCNFTPTSNGSATFVGSQSNPVAGTVTPVPPATVAVGPGLNIPRENHQATLLEDGTLLITGGDSGKYAGEEEDSPNVDFLQSTEIFNGSSFVPAADMSTPRSLHQATLLSNATGQVLITGGINGSVNQNGTPLASAELFTPGSIPGSPGTFSPTTLFDPAAGVFTTTVTTMNTPRYWHTATLLPNGKVLIAGGTATLGNFNPQDSSYVVTAGANGTAQNALATAEIFDPLTGTFVYTSGPMTTARSRHTATLLLDGTVLIAGGIDNNGDAINSAEIYNPATDTFTAVTAPMVQGRIRAQATRLGDGTVLITGGSIGAETNSGCPSFRTTSGCALATAEIYDPTAKTFTATKGPMSIGRYSHTATVLYDGTVLISGGITNWYPVGSDSNEDTAPTEEIYSPSTGQFAPVTAMEGPRYNHTATLLPGLGVFLVGGAGGDVFGAYPLGYTNTFPTVETYSPPIQGAAVHPKFMVLNVIYAPPGSGSSVTYTNTTQLGSNTVATQTKGNALTLNLGGNFGIGKLGASITANAGYTFAQNSTNTYVTSTTTTDSISVAGPNQSSLGVDHEADVIWIWLNPESDITLTNPGTANTPAQAVWTGLAVNAGDSNVGTGEMDVIPLTVGQLDGSYPIPEDVQEVLDRNWDPVSAGGAGGLTAQDFVTILQRDPFAVNFTFGMPATAATNLPATPAYPAALYPVVDPNVPVHDVNNLDPSQCAQRFQQVNAGQTFQFAPLGDINQPDSQTYSLQSNQSQGSGSGASDTYFVGLSVELCFGIGGPCATNPNNQQTGDTPASSFINFTIGDKYSWGLTQGQSSNNQTITTSALTIKNPLPSDNYAGPVQMQVWRDNLFGTYMFYPKATDTFVSVGTSAASTQAENDVTFTASVVPSPNIGSSGTTATPTGTVTFYDGCNVIGNPANLVNGSASVTTSWGSAYEGSHKIEAIYSGDGTFFHNDSPQVTETVGAPNASIPYIPPTGLSPISGAIGTVVTITGQNFGTTGSVTFNGVAASANSWSASAITVAVPVGATSGPVVVTANGYSSNGVIFTVTIPSTATVTTLSLAPVMSWSGSPVTASVVVTGAPGTAIQGTVSCSVNGGAATPAVPVNSTSGIASLTLVGVPTVASGSTNSTSYNASCTFTSGSSQYSGSQSNTAEGTVTNTPAATDQVTPGALNIGREGHQATPLSDGTVLITGGGNSSGAVASSEIYLNGFFTLAAQMSVAREGHQATLLGNSTGQVLVTGGTDGVGDVFSSAELFSPGPVPGSPGSFSLTTLYDPVSQAFTNTTTSLNTARSFHSATLLANGKVLIAGGEDSNGNAIGSAELYDPTVGNFTYTAGQMQNARYNHTATLLSDGTVLLTGGVGASGTILNTAEIYNPVTDTFTSTTGTMMVARVGAQATPVVSISGGGGTASTSSLVLITGGENASGTALNSAELYNVLTRTFSFTQDANGVTLMNAARTDHTATLLPDGTVLIAGGASAGTALQSEEIYSPITGDFSVPSSTLVTARTNHTATLIPGGSVLLVGGESTPNSLQTVLSSAETFNAAFAVGAVFPKFMVLDVLYAPPGAGSTMTYTNQTSVGTTTSTSSSFADEVSVSAGITIGVDDVTISPTFQWGHTATQSGTSSYSLTTNTTNTTVVPGPVQAGTQTQKSPVSIGVNHESDIIQIWLNPATLYTATANETNAPLIWNGFSSNPNDPNVAAGAMDVVSLTVSQLDGTSPIPPELQAVLERNWDPADSGGAGGISASDFSAILARDPFATNLSLNGQPAVPDSSTSYFDPNIPVPDPLAQGICSTRYSFNPASGQTFSFGQLGSTNQPETAIYQLQNTSSQATGNTTTDQYSVSTSTSVGVTVSTPALSFGASFSEGNAFTWTNTQGAVNTSGSTSTQALSIKNPTLSSNYTGPVQMQVWIDKLYGTYMFYPLYTDTSVVMNTSQTVAGNGDSVVLTTTVTADPKLANSSNPPLTPTGTVTFYDGCTVLSPVPLNAATSQASITVSSLGVGNHSILAAYSGDSNFHHNVSTPLSLTWQSSATASPFISSLSTLSGAPGSSVTIEGANLGTTGSVSFNGLAAVTTAWSSNAITAVVPPTATSGPVVVSADGFSSNGQNFTVLQPTGETSTSVSLAPATTWSGFPITANVVITGSGTSVPSGSVSCTVTSSSTSGTPTSPVDIGSSGSASVSITTLNGLPVVPTAGTSVPFTVTCNFSGTNGYANSQSAAVAGTATVAPPGAETATGSLVTGRENQAATLLEDGTVLIAGGDNGVSPLASAEIYSNGSFSSTASMTSARSQHQQTLLNLSTGQVLVTGGTDGVSVALSSAELYTPASTSGTPGTFQLTTQYDSEAQVFTNNVTSMTTARANHTATQLRTGQVLITGGVNSSGTVLNSAELYNPLTGVFTATKGSMNVARTSQNATLLLDGTVLITGGMDQDGNPLQSAEIYNPVTDSFALTTSTSTGIQSSMQAPRVGSQATLLGSGMVLITGGQFGNNTAELYNPPTGLFSMTTSISDGSQTYMVASRSYHSAVRLYDNTVLISGGTDTATDTLSSQELYDPTTGAFSPVATSLQAPRHNHSATLLPTQGVLLAGGEDTTSNGAAIESSAELYGPVVLTAGVHPKFMVLNIQYAPPGSNSALTYADSTTMGTSTGTENSFAHQTTLNYSTGFKFNIGVFQLSVVNTTTQTWLDSQDNTSTHALSTVLQDTEVVPGPNSSGLGVDHESDIIWLWLNPVADYTVTSSAGSSNIVWNGFDIDTADTNVSPGEMDVVPLSVSQLDGTANITNAQWEILDRNWDPISSGGAGGLTAADFLTILGRDPFATNLTGKGRATAPTTSASLALQYQVFDPNVPTLDPTTQACGTRYDFSPGFSMTFPYSQLGGDNQALTQNYLLSSNTASATSSATTDTYQVAISGNFLVLSGTPPVTPIDILGNQLAASTLQRSLNPGEQLAWTSRWTSSKNNAVLQTQALSIVNPLASDDYTGPEEIQVWKDNLYGTFMFYPKPSDTSWILTSNQSQINAGSLVTLTATVTPDPTIPYAPTGTVTFYDGCTVLGSAQLNPATGTASIPTQGITASGINTIEAIYSGDVNFFHNNAIPITISVN